MEEEMLYLCFSYQLANGRVLTSVKKSPHGKKKKVVLCEFQYILRITKHKFVFLR